MELDEVKAKGTALSPWAHMATVGADGKPDVVPVHPCWGPAPGAGGEGDVLWLMCGTDSVKVRNIAANPRVCVSFVDVFVQKGFKVLGAARNFRRRDMDYEKWAAPLTALAGPRFAIRSVIVIRITKCEPILAPSYQFYPDQTTEQAQTASAMRA